MKKYAVLASLFLAVTIALVACSGEETTKFTNAYGTPTTICAHSGCNNYIASSGDTNCCTVHSNKCLECGKYIDEDATYCTNCINSIAEAIAETAFSSSGSSGSSESASKSTTKFTNAYGTPTTICAHSGCTNYIASSGDTNCCTVHSRKCLECGKYIDEDATYCMNCLSKAAESSESASKSTTNFTNAYGTPTTKCAHSGCNNYIASSGDTNCCTVHSNKCLECGKYIDEDAMYCMSCLSKAAGSSSSSSSSSYSNNNSSSGYSYDTNDPYYSSNDHNGDGKLSDEEFEDAFDDYINDLMELYGD